MSPQHPDRDTDRDWEAIAVGNPYFGALNNPRYRGRTLTSDIADEFFQSGEADIAHTLGLFERNFTRPKRFNHALDFGCGVGRLLRAMSPHTDQLSGVDVSASMLKAARTHVPRANLSAGIPNGRFDWINSFIVFQHILPDRGLELLRQLLDRAAPDCFLSLHFTVDVLPRRDDGEIGRISLYAYNFPVILEMLADAGFSRVVTEYLRHGEDKAVRLVSARGRFAG